MSNPDAYIREIKSIDEALKRLNDHAKLLRDKKKKACTHLYNYMYYHNVNEYQGYKQNKLAPKEKTPRKKAKEKREDAYRFLRDAGVIDPEEFWKSLQATQKNPVPAERVQNEN
jgi:hypothetical protein